MIKADVAVIGGGMAGLPIANKAAYKGQTTVLFEEDLLGGTCLNRGCIPTKTMIHSARVAHTVRTASQFGVTVGPPTIDLTAIVRRKNEVLGAVRQAAYRQVEQNEKLTLIEERVAFEGPHRLRAGDSVVEADRIIINTGARSTIPSVEGLDRVPYHTNRTLLDVTELPDSLLVIGGGYVGVEFGQMFSRFGSSVTILQRGDRLVPREDPEISSELLRILRREGIEVVLNAGVQEVGKEQGHLLTGVSVNGVGLTFQGSALLVASGRIPNTDGLGLAAAGVKTDARGFIMVDSAFRTTQEHIWAIGDVVGPPMFTHSARDDADLLYGRLFKDRDATTEGRHVPYAIFTDPEIAAVGLTEEEAGKAGHDVKIGKHPFARVVRARAIGQTDGFVKIVADGESDRLLGAQIIGPHAGELIHELVVALDTGTTYTQIARSLHVHPTLSEGINAAAGGVHRPAGDT